MTRLNSFLVGFFRRNYPIVCGCAVLSNIVLSCSAWKSVTPQYVYTTVTNVVETVSVVTQLVKSSSSDFPFKSSPESSKPEFRPTEYPCNDYLYFVADGRKCVRLWGRIYMAGSLTSRGRVLDVFPDRVVLENGDSISNSTAKGSNNERNPDNPASR